jgi:hypothetical protein
MRLLAINIPVLFGMIFVNANLSKKFSTQTRMEETANDGKTFTKLTRRTENL